ncbi:MAG: hypothetical protein ABIN89_28885 [Chitinophagaceae bacterium]
MIAFKIFWSIDAIASLIILYFFVDGLLDGTVSSFNMGIWLALVFGVVVIMLGSIWLRIHQLPGFAIALLLVLAIPALLYLTFILIMMFGNGRWN